MNTEYEYSHLCGLFWGLPGESPKPLHSVISTQHLCIFSCGYIPSATAQYQEWWRGVCWLLEMLWALYCFFSALLVRYFGIKLISSNGFYIIIIIALTPRSSAIFWPLKVATAALTIIFYCRVLNVSTPSIVAHWKKISVFKRPEMEASRLCKVTSN